MEKVVKKDGEYVLKDGEQFEAADLDSVQKAVNQGTLTPCATTPGSRWPVLFMLSLGVGWWVSGRVLRPIGAITATAREISASDLSRRIGATGPHDELRTLADTIDDMLQRLEDAFAAQRHLVDEVSARAAQPGGRRPHQRGRGARQRRTPPSSSAARRPPWSPGPRCGWAG